ncbi:orotate phosphoribosyltransferase PyrE [Gottschalkia acidurici 9a]|uniref:Orotate phosphoribosyltransferase n=1 Tax=Gottschalkia acidurici (strain ATCC 7906 / DSM 604 / BCRC 14475 / CIP 104303 / KCTC 5404 / NCIMB 10678 / 9a) TaxID=1128398 RepID=K0AYY9_GOTA9|nr:orotate phosphoribosyltransferase [Gottschalkia acidurici]AFS77626.1 orotate phosphoribosyltransferase PyrE [Gottschalkia acidurici 9a]
MKSDILKVLQKFGAFQRGHFVLPSGKHSDIYIQCARLLQYPDKSMEFIEIVAKKIKNSNLNFDIILGPAIGGILISYELARQLNKPMIYIEKVSGKMTLGKDFEIKNSQKILIAEDVITSGKTVSETINLVEELGGEVVGIACMVNKENITLDKKIYSCINLDLKSYEEYECPFCKKNLPIQPCKI